jgi:pimeloyl-ACP methyl ester carboxylesterase
MIAAEKMPHLVAGLGLVSTAPWCIGSVDGIEAGMSSEYWAFRNQQLGSNGTSSPAAYAALFEHWLFKNPPSSVEVNAMVACAIQTPLYVLNCYRSSLASIDHRERAKRLKMPTLIMQGRHDRKQRYSGAAHLQSLIVGSRFVTFEDSAHMPQVEEMQKFNDLIASFAHEVLRPLSVERVSEKV